MYLWQQVGRLLNGSERIPFGRRILAFLLSGRPFVSGIITPEIVDAKIADCSANDAYEQTTGQKRQ